MLVTRKITPLLTLLVALFVSAASVVPAFAQDDQAHKKAYNDALEAAKAKKYNDAYRLFEEAVRLARAAGDNDVVDRSNRVLTQLDYSRGTQALKQENFEAALEHFNKGIAHDADNPKNYYGKGLALKNLDRTDEAVATYQTAVTKAQAARDTRTQRTAEDAIRNVYVVFASSALARGGETPTRSDAQEAVEHLTKLQELVTPDADAYYYLAEAHKALGAYDEAVAAADQGLAVHTGSRTDKAKLYFVKGEALMFQGNNAEAIAAFRDASYGSYRAPAEHFIAELGAGGSN